MGIASASWLGVSSSGGRSLLSQITILEVERSNCSTQITTEPLPSLTIIVVYRTLAFGPSFLKCRLQTWGWSRTVKFPLHMATNHFSLVSTSVGNVRKVSALLYLLFTWHQGTQQCLAVEVSVRWNFKFFLRHGPKAEKILDWHTIVHIPPPQRKMPYRAMFRNVIKNSWMRPPLNQIHSKI